MNHRPSFVIAGLDPAIPTHRGGWAGSDALDACVRGRARAGLVGRPRAERDPYRRTLTPFSWVNTQGRWY